MSLDIHPDIRKAWTLPGSWYSDPAAFEESREQVFARSWQFVTDTDGLKAPGSVWPFTLLEGCLDEPLLLSRDMDDALHCVSNVCTHRGNLVVEGAGVERASLRCRYHGRKFGLDGRFQSMPEFEGCEGFPSEKDDLAKVAFAVWEKFVFVKLAGTDRTNSTDRMGDRPFSGFLGPLKDRVGWMPLSQFVFDPSRVREYLVRAHWALYVDNYLEGFHIPYIHAGLNAALDYGRYEVELFPSGTLQLGIAKEAEHVFDLPQSSPDHGRAVSAYYFWLFPNTMFNFYPWGLSINVVKPLAPDLSKVCFYPFVWDPAKLGQGAGAELDRVEREDEAVVEMVQRGLRSRLYSRGRYSPTRETGTHWFHRMLCERLA